jgi:diguanylate cyclase (GGDEF)-like protein
MSKTVIDNMTLERLHELVKTHSGGIFITDMETDGDNYSMTLSDSCDVESLQDMAFKDYLSGIYNRRYFVEQLDQRIAEFTRNNETFGVVLLDLDNFTNINNTYGHEIGDIVIQHAAQSLSNTFKRKTDIVARLGGDEFVVLLSSIGNNSPEAFCKTTCERLTKAISKPISLVGGSTINVTASIGVAFTDFNDWQIPANEFARVLLRRADKAMYESKEKGKNTYSIYSNNNKNKGDTNVYKPNGSNR